MARPTKLTKELQNKIITTLRMGAYIETACAAAGIDRSCFTRWMQEKEDSPYFDNPIYKSFREAAKKAIAEAEVILLSEVRKKETNWQASMTIMERRWPDRWARREKVESNATLTITHRAEDLSDDQLAAVIAGRGSKRAIAPALGPVSAN